MPRTLEIDGVDYELSDERFADWKNTVQFIRGHPSHRERVKQLRIEKNAPRADFMDFVPVPFTKGPAPGVLGEDRTLGELSKEFGEKSYGQQIGEAAVGGVENIIAAPTVLAGLGGQLAGNLWGLATGQGGEKAKEIGQDLRHRLTYTPRSVGGQLGFNAAAELFHKGIEGSGDVGGALALPAAGAERQRPTVDLRPGEYTHLIPPSHKVFESEEAGRTEAAWRTAMEAGAEALMFILPAKKKLEQIREARAEAEVKREFERAKMLGREEESLNRRIVEESRRLERIKQRIGENRLNELREEVSRQFVEEHQRMAGPYKPGQVEKTKSLADREPEIMGPPRPEISRLQLEDSTKQVEPFPFETERHADSVPFELRQEVLERPEVREIIDSYRTEFERMKQAGEDTTQLQQAFGEYMSRYGVRTPQEAIGLQPLYEPNATRLPVEKRPSESPVPAVGPTDRGPTPFSTTIEPPSGYAGKFTKPVSDAEIRQWREAGIEKTPRGINRQRGSVSPDVFVEGTKWFYDKLLRLGWKKEWPFVPADLYNQDFRKLIQQDPALSQTEKTHILSFGPGGANEIRLGNKGLGPMRQGGQIDFGRGQRHTPYEKYAQQVRKTLGKDFPDETIRAMWKAKQTDQHKAAKQLLDLDAKKEAIAGVPGIKEKLRGFITETRDPTDPAVTKAMSEANDLPKGLGDRLLNKIGFTTDKSNVSLGKQLRSGGKMNMRAMDGAKHYHTKVGVDIVNNYVTDVYKNVKRLLFEQETGPAVVDKYDKLNRQERNGLMDVIMKYEGKKWLTDQELIAEGMNPLQIGVYRSVKEVTDWLYENGIVDKATYRPGYFPAKSLGDFYVYIREKPKTKGEAGKLIGIYSQDYNIGFDRAKRDITKLLTERGVTDFEFSDVMERVPFRGGRKGEGYAAAANSFRELTSILGEGDPRKDVVAEVIDQYKAAQMETHAGYYQHMKFKRGVEGLSGREFRTDKSTNADRAMRAFSSMVQQGVEYIEAKKAEKKMNYILDVNNERFPNKDVSKAYLNMYWDRARGVSNAFTRATDAAFVAMAHMMGVSGGRARSWMHWNRNQLMLMLIGWNSPRFLLAQVLQPNQFLYHNILQVMSRLDKQNYAFDAAEAWAVGLGHMFRRIGSKDWKEALREDPEMLKAVEYAEMRGDVAPRFFEDISSELQIKAKGFYNAVNGQWAIRKTESFARMQSYMTFVHLLRKNGLKGEELYQTAADLTNHTLVDYRPHEKPLIYQNLGLIGDLVSPLTTFKHNYYSQMEVLFRDVFSGKNRSAAVVPAVTAALTFLMWQQILSGMMGLPGKEDADLIIRLAKELGIVDPDTKAFTKAIMTMPWGEFISNGVSKVTGLKINKEMMNNIITHGVVSGTTGVDVSPTFSAAGLIPDQAHDLAVLPGKAWDIGKAAWRFSTEQTKTAGQDLARQLAPQSWPAGLVEKLIVDDKGNLPDTRHRGQSKLKRTEKQQNIRFLGARELEESKEATMLYQEKLDKGVYQRKRSLIIEKITDAAMAKDYNKVRKLALDAVKNLEMTPREIDEAVQQLAYDRKVEEEYRRLGKRGPKSSMQQRNYREQQRYQRYAPN